MAGEQHRSPLGLHLANAVLEYRLHERVESRCRFVEQEQFGIRRQRRNQSHFLPVPFRIGAGLLGRVELKTFEKLVAPPPIEVAPQPTEQIDHLPSRQVRPQTDLAGHVGQPAMQRDSVAPRVASKQCDLPGVRAEQPQQQTDGRRLARAVRPEKSVDLASLDSEVRRRSVNDVQRAIEWLAEVQGRCLVVHPGVLSDAADFDRRRAALAESLSELAPLRIPDRAPSTRTRVLPTLRRRRRSVAPSA